jgi:hypothetical protein
LFACGTLTWFIGDNDSLHECFIQAAIPVAATTSQVPIFTNDGMSKKKREESHRGESHVVSIYNGNNK